MVSLITVSFTLELVSDCLRREDFSHVLQQAKFRIKTTQHDIPKGKTEISRQSRALSTVCVEVHYFEKSVGWKVHHRSRSYTDRERPMEKK